MELVPLFLLVATVIWWIRRPLKVEYGSVNTELGVLSCRIGDEIIDRNGIAFRGIEVNIPKKFPHIYIDGHTSDSLMSGPRYVFNKNSKLDLEGDFNNYFQVYALPEYKPLALSVLQPDIMATLIDNVQDFDIEIYHDSIRIITNKKVFKHAAQQELLKQAAVKIVNELERRIRVWKAYDENHAGSTDLDIFHDSTTKIGNRSVASFTLAIGFIFGLIALGIAAFGWWLHLQDNPDYREASNYMYVAAFILFPCLWFASILVKKRRWF